VGEAGGQILAQPVAVRPAALGEALTAEGGSTDALPANPAALAGLAYPEGSALFHAGFAGDTFVAAAGGGNVKGFGVGGLVAYQTAGSVERLDPAGRPSQVSAQTDLRALLGIARGLPLVPVAAGASVEVIRSTLLEEFAATDVAGNLGLRTEIPGTALALGAAVTHWGGHLRYDDESLPIDHNALPFAYRFGLRWIALAHPVDTTIGTLESLRRPALRRPPPPHAVRLYADTVLRREERAVEYAGGAEYAWRDMVFLRGGFRRLAEGAARTRNLYALGAGIARGPVRIDYAIEMLEFTALHRVGLRVAGREEPEGRWAR
jgi:hypothetical protein